MVSLSRWASFNSPCLTPGATSGSSGPLCNLFPIYWCWVYGRPLYGPRSLFLKESGQHNSKTTMRYWWPPLELNFGGHLPVLDGRLAYDADSHLCCRCHPSHSFLALYNEAQGSGRTRE